ncbi:hypothetical protein KI387_042805, partial [Taxus chinensis]
ITSQYNYLLNMKSILRKVVNLFTHSKGKKVIEKHLKSPPNKKHVILYYTSSRAAGNTYSESSAVIAILHNLNISFQHRDVLLSRSYLEEIRDISGKCVSLPQLFMRGKCVGGYERIMELNERGKLKKLLGGYVNKSPREVCKGCGDMRHIVCFVCSGSKIFYREDLDEMV